MRLDLYAVMVALVLAATGPKSELPAPAQPPAAPNPISEALCGRKTSNEIEHAEGLDNFRFDAVPESWARLKRDELDQWLKVPSCNNNSVDEHAIFMRRRKVLQGIRDHLARAVRIDDFEKAVLAFPKWKPVNDDWPAPGDCESCDTLRRVATIAVNHVAQWPKRKKTDVIGSWLAGEEKREELVGLLCRAKPSPAMRADMEKLYRYYTWTPNGSKLLEVAKWFEREDVLEECR